MTESLQRVNSQVPELADNATAGSNLSQVMGALIKAAMDPTVDVSKMERIFDMQERMLKMQQEIDFTAALSAAQAEMPQIDKNGTIFDKNGGVRSRYAKIEDLDACIRPIISKYGLSVTFDAPVAADSEQYTKGTAANIGPWFIFSATLTHRSGYSRPFTIPLPYDKSEFRSNVQSLGSTESYAARRLLKMMFNIVERGIDDDGQGGTKLLDAKQVETIEKMLTETGASKDRFLAYMGVANVQSILYREFTKACNAIRETERLRNAQAQQKQKPPAPPQPQSEPKRNKFEGQI
jgi:ERF superfamily